MLEQFLIALIAAIAQAIAQAAVPAIVAGLQKPSTAEQSTPTAAEQQAVLDAIEASIRKGVAP